MTAAWKLVPSSPWSDRGRNPAFPLALAAHLALLGAVGIAALLRVTPAGEGPEPPPVLVTMLEPPPLEPVFEEERPDFEVVIPRGDTPTVPRLGREDAAPAEALPDVGPADPLTGLEDLETFLPSGIGPLVRGPRGSPDGHPDGAGTSPGDPEGEENAAPIPLDGRMTRPVLLHKEAPEYPHLARVSRLEGRVLVEAVIARDGSVEDVEIVQASNAIFERAALEAVRQWRYSPALLNGRAVRVVFRVNVEFVLQ